MELDELDPAVVLFAHHRIGKAFCCESLADTGCALENDVLLVPEQFCQCVVVVGSHVDLVEKVLFDVWFMIICGIQIS